MISILVVSSFIDSVPSKKKTFMGTWDFPVNHVVPITKKFPPSQARAIDIQQSMEQALKRVMVPWSSWKIMWSIFDSTHQEDRKVNVNFYRKISPFYLFLGCYFFCNVYMHTCMHIYMHTYVCTYVRTYIHTFIQSYIIHSYTRVYVIVCICMHIWRETDWFTYIHFYVRTITNIHCICIYMYIYIYVYNYIYIYKLYIYT